MYVISRETIQNYALLNCIKQFILFSYHTTNLLSCTQNIDNDTNKLLTIQNSILLQYSNHIN